MMLKQSMTALLAVATLAGTLVAAPAMARPDWDHGRPGYGHHDRRPGYWNGRAYYHPRGLAYRRWGTGQILPRAYWGGSYWAVNDWRAYGLAPVASGFRWVRVGPDALLVNVRNGHIRATRYGVFR